MASATRPTEKPVLQAISARSEISRRHSRPAARKPLAPIACSAKSQQSFADSPNMAADSVLPQAS